MLLNWVSLNAQTYYYSDDNQISISENKTSAIFCYSSIPTSINYDDVNSLIDSSEYSADSTFVIVNLVSEWSGSIASLISYLGINQSHLIGSSFSYALDDGTKIYPSLTVVLKLNDGYELNDIQSLLSSNGLSYLRTDFDNIIATATDLTSTISAANAINNNSMLAWCQPDFFVRVEPAFIPNDPLFPFQYYLRNPTTDIDIDADDAWNLTTGNGTVTIAVIDDGVANHDEMNYPAKVLNGWSFDNTTPPGSPPNIPVIKSHGQRMAGIIGASQNNQFNGNFIGISGVCPNSRILPVRIAMSVPIQSAAIANGINFAWVNGADVLSCSWNISCSANPYQNITNAINNALISGRGGLGCPVVFSAGNHSSTCVYYPASLPGVIAVSALTQAGTLTSYSDHDISLSVAAFGGAVNGCCYDLYTTCNMTEGNVNGNGTQGGLNYIDNTGGTSSACAQTSGTAALLISMNPTLSGADVYCRIRNSATDIGTFGFDNSYGFGRLNSYYCVAINNLNLNDATIAGLQNYATRDYITSGAGSEILPTANVSLVAGRAITLNPGFKTDLNSVFSATINTAGPCGTNGGGPFRVGNNNSNISEVYQNTNMSNLITLAPNPSRYNLLIASKNTELKINKIIVSNIVGKKVMEIYTGNTNSYLLDVSNLVAGVYLIKINSSFGQIVKKFIRQ
jgi:hypothetical protein